MPTFLTTSRMDPELAARIEASVSGSRPSRRRPSGTRRIVAVARFVFVATVIVGIWATVSSRRRYHEELERSRAALLEAVRTESASMRPEDLEAVPRAESWLVRSAAAYEGDLVSASLRPAGAFATTLTRPIVWVRGPTSAFASATPLSATTAISAKDALVACLLHPPPARTEKAMIDEVRIAYMGGGAMESRTANVRRLHDAVTGLPVLAPEWTARVRSANEPNDLAQLRRELDRAALGRAKEAARSELLLAAIDEPGDGGGPTELDGERPHMIRVVLVDLASKTVLLRLRRHVDPSWISVGRRPTYATGLDGCQLAWDIHDRLRSE